jgi:hypothetical protein
MEQWLIVLAVGIILIIAGILLNNYGGRKPLTVLGQALWIIGLIVVAIALILLLSTVFLLVPFA